MQINREKLKGVAAKIYEWGRVALRTRAAITVWRILMIYVALQICRATFYFYNKDLIGTIESEEIWLLFKGSLVFDNASIMYSLALYMILTLFPVSQNIWNNKWYRWVTFGIYILPVAIMLIANLGDVVYFHYTQKRCTAEEIFFANNSNTTQLMFQFLIENWYLAILFAALMTAIVFGYRTNFTTRDIVDFPKRDEREEGVKAWFTPRMLKGVGLFALLRMVVMSLMVLFAVYGIRGGLTRMTRPITLSNSMLYTFSPNKANLILSNPFCIIRTMSHHLVVPHFFDEKEVDAIYTPSHYPEDMQKSELFGCCEGYNVVVFILESFSAEHSAYLMPEIHSGQGYTPHLDNLMRNGLTLDRCYANGLTSIAAPPAVWSSIPSYEHSFMLMAESLAEYKALPTILKDKGYRTAFFCGSEHGSMGFGAYAHLVDIEELYSMDDYYDSHGECNFDDAWGIWDEPFIDFMGEKLSGFNEPFFASIITLTSHHPFNVPDSAKGELPMGTTLNHRPIAYTDRAVGRFMEKYKDEEWFKHTLFVFVADHVSSERMAERTLAVPGCFHIVGAMYTPDGALPAQRYEHVASQVDIMPTVLGLLGCDEPYFAIGRDIFNEPHREPFTLIRSGYAYTALTDDCVVDFAESSSRGAYRYDDYRHSNDISSKVNMGRIDSLIKATLQQYYTHVSRRVYFPKKR